ISLGRKSVHEYIAEGQRCRRSPGPLLNVIHQPINLLQPDPGDARKHSPFSLDATGFEIPKIELLIERAPSLPDRADRMPRVQPGPAVCRPGDLWELGRHLIYCGNALDEPSYKVLMGEDRAAMVFTEPLRDTGSAGHVYELSPMGGERSRFLIQVCALLSLYSRPGSLHYLCADWRHTDQL